ncbi:MAG: YdcF family protein [Rhodospirillales bacterium]|nr:YdcF family protein [Rhodospirillales bacterium]
MFFTLSKVLWFIANPSNVLLVLLCAGVVLLFTRWRRAGRRLVGFVAVTGVVLAVVPFGGWLYGALEDRFPQLKELPARVDGIVVAGGVVDPVLTAARGKIAIGGAAERLFEMAELSKRYPQAKIVFTGGSGSLFYQDKKEAHAVVPLIRQLGLDPGKIIFEDQSRNTVENAEFSYRVAKPKKGETWLLVTSAFHMPRAVGCFRKAGWTIVPYPVDFGTRVDKDLPFIFDFAQGLGMFGGAIHEYLGLFFYWLSGKTDELYPGPGR